MGAVPYYLSKCAVQALFLPFVKIRTLRVGRTSRPGPWLLAANHLSHFDPPFFTSRSHRMIDWIAMTELFSQPWMARYFKAVNCIEVDRFGRDTHAVREAVRRLQAGRVVGVFPEGGIRAGEGSVLEGAPFKGGVGVLSQMTGAPVLPAIIVGSDRCYARGTWKKWRSIAVCMSFGDWIEPDPGLGKADRREQVERELASAFVRLYAEAKTHFQLQPVDLPTTPQARKGHET